MHSREKAPLRSLGATEHSAEQRNVLSGAECRVCGKPRWWPIWQLVVKLLFFIKGCKFCPWNGWMKPRNNVLAVIAGIFQIGGLFCFSVLLFSF
jgi:hypothetical protein